jgi:hypothetical protein
MVEAYINKMMVEVTSNTKEGDERSDARWKVMLQKQAIKLKLDK